VFAGEGEGGFDSRTLISMDPPEHREYRALVSPRFTPRALRASNAAIERISSELFERWAESGPRGECDFVQVFAAPLPIAVIAHLLGVPGGEWKRIFDWTNRIVGAGDPEYRSADSTPAQTRRAATVELFDYFRDLAKRRLADPRDDLVSLLAHARIGGRALPELELLSYFLILVAAGNETTRNAISGGLLALIEHPAEREKLARSPELVPQAAEEILRWTSPVVQMARTATRDVELEGQRIREGDLLVLFYASANRDEAVFAEPERFSVERDPNRHLAFGIGEHVCAGAHLARLELRAALAALVSRLAQVELAGPVERLRSSAIGGVKRLPIRYALHP
jgi:cytochrome P450